MTKTETTKCQLCETATATLLKREIERTWSEANGGRELEATVELPICAGCAEMYYDGTEDFPGTQPLG